MEHKGISKRKNRIIKIIIGITLLLSIVAIVNFIPTWNLKTSNMKVMEGNWVNVYYEAEEEAAKDVFQYADTETESIARKLGFDEKQNVRVFIYDNQMTMQRKKYGLIGPILGLDWYIGDNIGTDVILTSPANPGPVHDYTNNKNAVLHEIVHAYVSVMNKDIDLWVTEGIALYLSNGKPFYKDYLKYMEIPSYKDICTSNPITFSNVGGYTFSNTYIEYLDKTYSWDSVLKLIKTEDYESVFGKSKKDIYKEWKDYITDYYQ